jgi:hypothetical protein
MRVTDVSPGAKDAMLRDILNRVEKDLGASTFERVYFSKEDLRKMGPEEKTQAVKLQALSNVLAQRAKARKKEREARQTVTN